MLITYFEMAPRRQSGRPYIIRLDGSQDTSAGSPPGGRLKSRINAAFAVLVTEKKVRQLKATSFCPGILPQCPQAFIYDNRRVLQQAVQVDLNCRVNRNSCDLCRLAQQNVSKIYGCVICADITCHNSEKILANCRVSFLSAQTQ